MKINQLLESKIDLDYWPNQYILDQISVDSDQAVSIWNQHSSNEWYNYTLSTDTVNDQKFTDYILKKFNISSSPDWDRSCYCEDIEDIHGEDGEFLLLVYPGDQGADLIISYNTFNDDHREIWLDGPVPLLQKAWEEASEHL